MTIAEKLDSDLKEAMRARNSARTACIRQIRSKVQEAVNAPGFDGQQDDALFQKIIASYIKSLEKSMVEMRQGGERAQKLIAGYQDEIDYLKPYLPQMLDETSTRKLVKDAIATSGATGKGQAGKVIGVLMKSHRGQIDAQLAKSMAEQLLGA